MSIYTIRILKALIRGAHFTVQIIKKELEDIEKEITKK